MSTNQELAKIVDENKHLMMIFDGKSLYWSAMADDESCYPSFESSYLFSPDKEKNFFNSLTIELSLNSKIKHQLF